MEPALRAVAGANPPCASGDGGCRHGHAIPPYTARQYRLSPATNTQISNTRSLQQPRLGFQRQAVVPQTRSTGVCSSAAAPHSSSQKGGRPASAAATPAHGQGARLQERVFIFGLGYCGVALAAELKRRHWCCPKPQPAVGGPRADGVRIMVLLLATQLVAASVMPRDSRSTSPAP